MWKVNPAQNFRSPIANILFGIHAGADVDELEGVEMGRVGELYPGV